MKQPRCIIVALATTLALWGKAPDFRPAFDKTAYAHTLWTQVNPWWHPSKPRREDTGGPNYARKIHPLSNEWGSAMEETYPYGRLNWQAELQIDAPNWSAETLKKIKQAEALDNGIKIAFFVGMANQKDTQTAIRKWIRQFEPLEQALKSSPVIYRLNGAPVIATYNPLRLKPEQWKDLIPAFERRFGKCIWLFGTWGGKLLSADETSGTDILRQYMPYFDGVTQYGNYAGTAQEDHYRWLVRFMREEYPQKIIELSAQNAYSNHFHFGGIQTKLSQKWRASLDNALSHQPDSLVLTNFFDHYENSLVMPCYEREDFMLRYAHYKVAQWRKEPFPKHKTPELVLTNYVSIMLGRQSLDFEVIGFPIDSRSVDVILQLDLCDCTGKVLHTFPDRKVTLKDLQVATFTIPSERFPHERGIVPRLRYRWQNRTFKMNHNPMTLISPSLRPYWMFWARSTANALQCKVLDAHWTMNGIPAGGLLDWPRDGIVTIESHVKATFGKAPNQGGGFMRIMRNGLEIYSHQEGSRDLNLTRAFTLPCPADALNYYHLEMENKNGYRYQTLPIWMTSNTRPGQANIPFLMRDGTIRTYVIEKARVPFFHYPANGPEGLLAVDHSGYLHNGRFNGTWAGGHLGHTGYYHYHNGMAPPTDKPLFKRDRDGRGHWHFSGKDYLMIMGGTAFPGAATYELSFRAEKIGDRMGLIGTANKQINLSLEPDGRLLASHGPATEGIGGAKPRQTQLATVRSKTAIRPGTWYRVAFVYDLRELKLYVNNKLEATCKAYPTLAHEAINHMTVGALCNWVYNPVSNFTGDIRNIRFYGRNLDTKELLQN